MRTLRVFMLCFLLCFLSKGVFASSATAVIKGTAEGSAITGDVTLQEVNGGLEIEAKVSNVPPGKHGFHVHEKGSCDDMGKAAGGHYNPDNVMHGMVMKDGFQHAHPGDLGNIEVAADGTGNLKAFIPNLALTGEKYNVSGKAVILHEKEDDFSQPTGNAGGRIGCGIIGTENKQGPDMAKTDEKSKAESEAVPAKPSAKPTSDEVLNPLPEKLNEMPKAKW